MPQFGYGADSLGPIAVIAALRQEMMPTVARLGLERKPGHFNRYEGAFNGRPVLAVIAGLGAASLVATLNGLYRDKHVRAVILIGYCGALTDQLQPAELIQPHWVMDEHHHAVRVDEVVPRLASPDQPGRLAQRTLLTADDLVATPEAKARFAERYRAISVDMETFPLARRAAELGIQLRIFRAVTDTASMQLPEESMHWVRPDGSTDNASVMRYVMSHPRVVPTLMRLARHAKDAGNVLATATADLLMAQDA